LVVGEGLVGVGQVLGVVLVIGAGVGAGFGQVYMVTSGMLGLRYG
jgi:hypothetical protein